MALQFIFGNSGVGKSRKAYENIIRESMEYPSKKYFVIVPDQFTMQTQKELVSLHPNHGIWNIDVLSFQRLALNIFEEVGQSLNKILEETGKSLVLRKIAQENQDDLKLLGSNLKKIGYINEIKSMISEFKQYTIELDQIEELMEKTKNRPQLYYKLRDMKVLYEAFGTYLKDEYITAEEILEVLCQVVERSELLRGSVFVFDGFTGFTPIQYRVMSKLLSLSEKITVVLTLDTREDYRNIAGDYELFYLSKKTAVTLENLAKDQGIEVDSELVVWAHEKSRFTNSEALGHLEQNLFRYGGRKFQEEQDEIEIQMLKNPKKELEWVAGEIKNLVREKGYHYRDIGVISGNLEGYGRYVEQVMSVYEIPYFLDQKRSVLFNPLVELIHGILEIGEQDFSYESMFLYLRCGLSGLDQKRIDVLENYVLALGIRGEKRWKSRWIRLYGSVTEEDLADLNALREEILEKLLPTTQVLKYKKSTVQERTKALYEHFVELEVEQKLSQYEQRFEEEGNRILAKEYQQVYKIVMNLFDKLVDLLGEEILTGEEYIQVLDAGFTEAKVGNIPPGNDQIVIGDMERTRLKDVKALFFLGVNEGNVPKTDGSAGVFSEADREELLKSGLELAPTTRQKTYIQRFYLYLNLTKPSEKLYLLYSSTDMMGKALRPSYLINSIKQMYPTLEVKVGNPEAWDRIETVRQGLDHFVKEIQGSVKGSITKELIALYHWYKNQEECRDKIEKFLEVSYKNREEKYLTKEVAQMLYGQTLNASVTRLEKFAACAYAHFVEFGLQLKERDLYEFQPVDMGNIFHEVLEKVSKFVETSEYSFQSAPKEKLEEWVERALEDSITDYGNTILHSSARNEYVVERMKRMLKRTVWGIQKQLQAGEFMPESYEVSFASVSDLEAIQIVLSEEEKIHLRGRIDRVDTCEDSEKMYVKVVDYKSGMTSFQLLSFYHGLQLQLVVYLNAAIEMQQRKHPQKEVIPAGVFYYRIQDPVLEGEKISPEMIQEELLEKLKVDGLVNDDREIIEKLDGSIDGKSKVLPIAYNKDGSLRSTSSAISTEQFKLMTTYLQEKMKTLGTNVLDGEIGLNPYELEGKKACDYCKYLGICGLDKKEEEYPYKRLENLSEEEIWEKMKGEET